MAVSKHHLRFHAPHRMARVSQWRHVVALLAAFLAAILLADVCHAQTPGHYWDGPTTGPVAQAGKRITFISDDLKNGGITIVYRGFYTATLELGWDASIVDGKGDPTVIQATLANAIRTQPDAIVFGGFQPDARYATQIAQAKARKIVLAGWHAAETPGPTHDLFINIATDVAEVAARTVEHMVQTAKGEIGVIIFNDDRFAVANAKTRKMRELIEQCSRCKLLSVENIPISTADKEIPQVVVRLDKTWGRQWTHTLAINDKYFDVINFPLAEINRRDIQNIAAGDGSNVALGRIRSGRSQQIATVAEPSGIQGWQLADELNRAFAGKPPSGYVSKPILVTTHLLQQMPGAEIDAGIPYREAYRTIWKGTAAQK